MDGILTRVIKIHVTKFPTFMYDLSYDPDNRAEGLMRGIPLVRVCSLLISVVLCPASLISVQAF